MNRYQKNPEESEILESEEVYNSQEDFDIPNELPENHSSVAAEIDLDVLEYEPTILESVATDSGPLGFPVYMASTGGPALMLDLATQGIHPELTIGGIALGAGAWAVEAGKRGYKEARKSSAEDDIEGIYLVGDEDVEGFLEDQENILMNIDDSNEIWSGRDASDLYSMMEDLSIVTFERYDGEEIDYQIDVFPSNTTFYGIDDEAPEYFENGDSLINNIEDVKEKLN